MKEHKENYYIIGCYTCRSKFFRFFSVKIITAMYDIAYERDRCCLRRM